MKNLCLFLLLTVLLTSLDAAKRVVTLELFLGYPCGGCEDAERKALELSKAYQDDLLVVVYFPNVVGNEWVNDRADFYPLSGTPDAWFDGTVEKLGGATNPLIFYDTTFKQRAQIPAPLTIDLKGQCIPYPSLNGKLTATVMNVSEETLSGKLLFVVTESAVLCQWGTLDTLDRVERDMLPDAQGVDITLAPGEEKVFEREFAIDTTWPHFTKVENIQFGCFVQGGNKEIYQSAILDYAAIGVQETVVAPVELKLPEILRGKGSLSLALQFSCYVSADLYDASGRLVEHIFSGRLAAGTHDIPFDTNAFPSGTYFFIIDSGSQTTVKKPSNSINLLSGDLL